MKRISIILSILFLMACLSCENKTSILSVDDDKINDITIENTNSPTIRKEKGSFTFGLKGKDFTGTSSETIDFDINNLVLAINLENYQNGNCSMKIFCNDNHEIFQKNIKSNIIYSEVVTLDDIPEQIVFEFEKFSGTIKAALGQDD